MLKCSGKRIVESVKHSIFILIIFFPDQSQILTALFIQAPMVGFPCILGLSSGCPKFKLVNLGKFASLSEAPHTQLEIGNKQSFI